MTSFSVSIACLATVARVAMLRWSVPRPLAADTATSWEPWDARMVTRRSSHQIRDHDQQAIGNLHDDAAQCGHAQCSGRIETLCGQTGCSPDTPRCAPEFVSRQSPSS